MRFIDWPLVESRAAWREWRDMQEERAKMAHTRGGGIGNMPGSDDRTIPELIEELRQRVRDDKLWQSYAEVSGDEIERLAARLKEANEIIESLLGRSARDRAIAYLSEWPA